MKRHAWIILSLVVQPVFGQSLLGTLNQHQRSIQSQESSANPRERVSETEVRSTTASVAAGSGSCTENDQTSLPLSYLTSLIQSADARLEVVHDPRRGTLRISAPDIIGNCSSMIAWKLKEQEMGGERSYAVEAQIKQGEDCNEDGCLYRVARVEGSAFREWESIRLKPSLNGFEECLKRSGVIEDGRVKAGAIYSAPLRETFDGVSESGRLLFVSHGPSSALARARYGNFESIEGCDHYENISEEPVSLLSLQDEERRRLDAEAASLSECSVNEYHRVTDFIERYQEYASVLGAIRDNLILEAAKKSAEAIAAGNPTEDDFRVVADFDRYIVQPKVERANSLYVELRSLQGSAAAEKRAELSGLLTELRELNARPYFEASHTTKLISTGRFEEAERINTIKLTLDRHSRLGSTVDGAVMTPELAQQKVASARAAYQESLATQREDYALRTGQITGREEEYRGHAASMRHNVQTRTQNYYTEMAEEYTRIQPGGYCYAYFRNTQRCIQESTERIQELQALLVHYNRIDNERAVEYDTRADRYGRLEAQGRRYVAAQNGEEVPEERPAAAVTTDTTLPTRRQTSGQYTFDYQPQQFQSMPATQQSGMINPLAAQGWYGGGYQQQQQQQQPFLGQQAYGGPNFGGGAYNFSWGGGAQQQQQMGYGPQQQQMGYGPQQQQQSGYWSQPYSAYNMYSMYGR